MHSVLLDKRRKQCYQKPSKTSRSLSPFQEPYLNSYHYQSERVFSSFGNFGFIEMFLVFAHQEAFTFTGVD
ncbi:MAG: hypothetical protein CMI66_05200 [Pedosphaera sp.]|nr:hypothetical protein [Pedosphaera sp.]HBP57274.1 hypothetical protein [Verrucomicrobiales bacterium]HCZ04668.1 hypothetical protein [Verrucomicrobiales bacterium]